jgi:hypothetical protein
MCWGVFGTGGFGPADKERRCTSKVLDGDPEISKRSIDILGVSSLDQLQPAVAPGTRSLAMSLRTPRVRQSLERA